MTEIFSSSPAVFIVLTQTPGTTLSKSTLLYLIKRERSTPGKAISKKVSRELPTTSPAGSRHRDLGGAPGGPRIDQRAEYGPRG